MAEIQIGSLVIYTERRASYPDANRLRPRNGSIGTVLKVTDGYRRNDQAFDVDWISGGCLLEQRQKFQNNGWYAVWAENLDLAEMPYDPTQQGDTDDDI